MKPNTDPIRDEHRPIHHNKTRRERPQLVTRDEPIGYINGEPLFGG